MRTESPEITPQWDLLWRVRLSALYHLKRERFLDGVDRFSKAVSALGGAAALSQIKAAPDWGLWFTGIITLVCTLSLVYGPSGKARKHAELARDFKRLEADVVAAGIVLTDAQLAAFDARYLTLVSSEPAALGALVTQCHNELATSIGQQGHITPMPLLHRLFKNWFDIDQTQKPLAG